MGQQTTAGKQGVCMPPKRRRGLNMIDVDNFIRIKQVKWVDVIVNSDHEEWNAIAKHWFKRWDLQSGKKYFVTTCSSLDNIDTNAIPTFYREALGSWVKLRQLRNISNRDEILKESLFANNHIKSMPGQKSVIFYSWLKSDIRYIKDIWDDNKNSFISETSLLNKLRQTNNWMTQYLTIKQAIPKNWLAIIKGDHVNIANSEPTVKISEEEKILIRGKELKKTQNRDILFFLHMNYSRPRCENYWEGKFNKKIPWKQIWQNLNECKVKNKIRDFQWKSIHNTLNTNARLKLMQKSNGMCPLCNKDQETQSHLFKNCNVIRSLVIKIGNKLNDLNLNSISEENIIFGYDENLSRKQNLSFGWVIFNFKWVVWKNRNNKIFNQKTETCNVLYKRTLTFMDWL